MEDEELLFGEKEYLTDEMRKSVGMKKEDIKGNSVTSNSKVKV